MEKLARLAQIGQSIWYDHVRRSFLAGGELTRLLKLGIRGVTSNPSIFAKAISGSTDYDEALERAAASDIPAQDIYEQLAVEDIRSAADALRTIYHDTEGLDGYISLEVSPKLAYDTDATVREAERLYTAVGRPNLMIKVPATEQGIPAVTELIGRGINVNVTLIFDRENYHAVAEAYMAGLQRLAEGRQPERHSVASVASVASFFISRIDTAVDRLLEEKGNESLRGRIAIANARLAYADSRLIFSGDRWRRLASLGARIQRVLWASTSTKNPRYPDTLYVDELIGPDTVNTVPPATLHAFLDHGTSAETLTSGADEAAAQMEELTALGIDLSRVTRDLQEEGVAAFADSFDSLMQSIEQKRRRLASGDRRFFLRLGSAQDRVERLLERTETERVVQRIWEHDHTVWKPDPAEITNRLGWLHSPEVMQSAVSELEAFAEEVRADGIRSAVLLGMGGSSLAPEVYREVFGVRRGFVDLRVLDSTDPGAVLDVQRAVKPEQTLFVVSTKSGGTVETLSFMKYFYGRMVETLGERRASRRFVAVTDPGSGLETIARSLGFRRIFLNDPNIGGRYSALSYFGLVPAALLGIDLVRLLERAQIMACAAEGCSVGRRGGNSPARLGAAMGELAALGRDKLTLITSPALRPFGPWVEQLIAESTGKEGKGIVPVTGETLTSPELYPSDRFFVYLRLEDEDPWQAEVQDLCRLGHPAVEMILADRFDLGGEIFRWEMATAVAGARLGINPFDQPDVESAKKLAREMMAAYRENGTLPEPEPTLQADGMRVYSAVSGSSVGEQLRTFLAPAGREGGGSSKEGGGPSRPYVALQAYVRPTAETDEALQKLRTRIQTRCRAATTVGYGPRFLHSTGQLHKGDAGNGLFIQLTADMPEDAAIPDEPRAETSAVTFGVLKTAQALGDRQALLDAGRRVIRFHLGSDVVASIEGLTAALE